MFRQVVVACFVAGATAGWHGPLAGGAPAHQYPAGVSPQACPNFPHCDNPAVAANPNAPAPIYNAIPAYNAYHGAAAYQAGPAYYGGYAGEHSADFTGVYAPKSAAESGQYTGDGDYRGEGLAESGAYGVVGKNNYQPS